MVFFFFWWFQRANSLPPLSSSLVFGFRVIPAIYLFLTNTNRREKQLQQAGVGWLVSLRGTQDQSLCALRRYTKQSKIRLIVGPSWVLFRTKGPRVATRTPPQHPRSSQWLDWLDWSNQPSLLHSLRVTGGRRFITIVYRSAKVQTIQFLFGFILLLIFFWCF